jgi:hypothetical protein
VPVLAQTVSTGQPDTRNVIVSRDGKFLFVSHGRPFNPGPDTLVVFPILPGGTLGQARPPIPIGGGGSGMAITPNGRFLYVACAATNDVFGFRIGRNGVLNPVPGGRFPAPRTPEGVAITPDGTRLYVTSVATRPESDPDEAGVWTFTISPDGSLTAQGPRAGTRIGPGVATPDGRHLYTGDALRTPCPRSTSRTAHRRRSPAHHTRRADSDRRSTAWRSADRGAGTRVDHRCGSVGAAFARSSMLPDMIVRRCSVMCWSGQSHQASARRRSMSASP